METYAKQNPSPIVVVAGCAFLIFLIFGLGSPTDDAPPSFGQEQVRVELPVRLVIPRIGVDAAVEFVSLTPEGAMAVPKEPADAAWFEPGPRPGEEGSAVIAGHYGWKDGTPAVFDELHTLQKGDKIYVEDETGTTTVFVVRELRRYGEYEDASDVFGSNDGKEHLNLVTCEGAWNKLSKSYAKRLVVFADKE